MSTRRIYYRALQGFAALLLTAPGYAQPTSQPTGLDALNDEKLLNELSSRGLSQLLERAFVLARVPPEEQTARRTILALRDLSENSAKFSPAQKQALIAKIVAGMDAALPKMTDPEALMQQAKSLLDIAAARQVDALELWGDSAAVRQSLRPVAETIVRLFDRAADISGERVESLGNQANVNDQQLERFYQLQQLATFSARMGDYLVAVALPPGDAQRVATANRGAAYLQTLDVADQPIRVAIRLQIGKLQALAGDFDKARATLVSIIDDQSLQPRPSELEQFQARYHLVVTELLARSAGGAEGRLTQLNNWQSAHAAADAAIRAAAEAAAAMLQFRVHELVAQSDKDPARRRAAADAAVAVLSKLLEQRPDLAGAINTLLIARLPADAPMKSLDPLLLQAIVRRGEEERLRPVSENADEKLLRRAIAAAEELISRGAVNGVDAALLDNCRFVVPFLYQRLNEPVEAGERFLDYAQAAGPGDRGAAALDQGQAVVAALRADRADEEPIRKLYDRFLPLAIDRFNRRQFAYEYARRLQLMDQPELAAKYFRLVPADDGRALAARFYLMLSAKQHLDRSPRDAPGRAAELAEIQALADEINALAGKSSDAAARLIVIRTRLLAAEMARTELRDPQRALKLLDDIEAPLNATPAADSLLPEVLLIRVQAYMAAGATDRATESLVKLLNQREGGEGAAIVYTLLEKLNSELDAARLAGDAERMRSVARNRAALSGFLAQWATSSGDPKINKFAYRYSVFDAASKQLSADLTADPAEQTAARRAALDRYRSLESPEKVTLYRATRDAAATPSDYDPAVSFGIAQLCFDLGEFREARDRFARLLNDRRLGAAVMSTREPDGSGRETDNDQYWEAVLKFLRSNLELGENLEQSRNYLREQQIRWGDRVGGRRWKADFAALQRDLVGVLSAGATTATATQPADHRPRE